MVAFRERNKKGFFLRQKEMARRRQSSSFWKNGIPDDETKRDGDSDYRCANEDVSILHRRRMVELDVLAKGLDSGCKTCGKPLQLSHCCDETISGLGSFLYINCVDCGEMNVCVTNKKHRTVENHVGRPIFDVNTKLAAGIYLKHQLYLCGLIVFVVVFLVNSELNYFLKMYIFMFRHATCRNFAVGQNTLKAREREVGPAVEQIAKRSCEDALAAEKECWRKDPSEVTVAVGTSYDMG